MKCDRCENEATVHETTRKNGVTVEKHLCEKCASENGLASAGENPVHELLQQFAVAHAALMSQSPQAPSRQTACPACGLSFAEFKQGGMVGCAMCYKAFEAQLEPLLDRAHEGATRHSGKQPTRLGALSKAGKAPAIATESSEDRAKAAATLRKQLDEAVKAEQYERAAKLRDELRNLLERTGTKSAPQVGGDPPVHPHPGNPG